MNLIACELVSLMKILMLMHVGQMIRNRYRDESIDPYKPSSNDSEPDEDPSKPVWPGLDSGSMSFAFHLIQIIVGTCTRYHTRGATTGSYTMLIQHHKHYCAGDIHALLPAEAKANGWEPFIVYGPARAMLEVKKKKIDRSTHSPLSSSASSHLCTILSSMSNSESVGPDQISGKPVCSHGILDMIDRLTQEQTTRTDDGVTRSDSETMTT